MKLKIIFLFIFLISLDSTQGRSLIFNAFEMKDAPAWVSQSKTREVISKIERKLEWTTRKTTIQWHLSQEDLVKSFGKDAPDIFAFTKRSNGEIHIGPKVVEANYAHVLGHELAHVILLQKYKNRIPLWIEEGLANHVAGVEGIDYTWLKNSPPLALRTLAHPFDSEQSNPRYAYMATSAAVKMLEAKCPSLRELLNLSLKLDFETILSQFCKIKDLDQSFLEWVNKKSKL